MASHRKTPSSDLLRVFVVLALGAAIGTWCADASAAPVTVADAATTPEDTPIEVPVLENDFEDSCVGPGPCIRFLINIASVTQPANGTVSIIQHPGFQPDVVRYTPRE